HNDVYLLPYNTDLSSKETPQNVISIAKDIAPLSAGHLHVVLLGDGGKIGNGLLGDTALQEPTFAIISASKRDEDTYEASAWSGSAFANELVAALGQNIPDLDGDGLISVEELYLYLYPRLVQLTKKLQHPSLFGTMTHRMYLSQAPELF